MSSPEVVVVGAGVVGASVAYHLAVRGARVRVLERAEPGAGSTGRATGGFRAQFGTKVNVALSLLSREKLLALRDETGVDPCYRPHGYLFLAQSEAGLEALREALAVQRAAGLFESREVGREEALELNPALAPDGFLGGSFCPTDGFLRPMEVLRGYREAAERLGARFEPWAHARLELHNGRARVRTADGLVEADAVVNAAGPWAGRLAQEAGLELPVVPLRRQVAPTVPYGGLPGAMPMTIFLEDGFHLRVRDGRVLLLWPHTPAGPDPYDEGFDEAWLAPLLERAHRRVPRLAGVPVDRAACWAGLYEMSPDRHALLGRAGDADGLYVAAGSSGHGVMHAPALGQLLAEVIIDGEASSFDAHQLRPSRFAEGEPIPGPSLL